MGSHATTRATMRLLCLFLALAFFASFALAQVAGPRILVSRSILNHELLVNKDAVVNVEIYNVGEEPALDIQYMELGSFDEFETVIGAHSASWPKLAPGAKISHNFVVRPAEEGQIVVGNAHVEYRSASNEAHSVRIADRMEYNVDAFSEYQRATSPHLKEWIIFGVLSVLPSALALSSWLLYQSAYSGGLKKGSDISKAVEKAQKKKSN